MNEENLPAAAIFNLYATITDGHPLKWNKSQFGLYIRCTTVVTISWPRLQGEKRKCSPHRWAACVVEGISRPQFNGF